MADFAQAWPIVLDLEGRGTYVDLPADRGGPTRWGISQRAYPGLDIRNLTRDAALALYRRDYWDAVWGDRLVDQEVAVELFEQAVNFGPRRTARHAVLHAQRVLTMLGRPVAIDGRMGPQTLAALNAQATSPQFGRKRALLVGLNGEQYLRYRAIVAGNASQQTFIHGWLGRVATPPTELVQDDAVPVPNVDTQRALALLDEARTILAGGGS